MGFVNCVFLVWGNVGWENNFFVCIDILVGVEFGVVDVVVDILYWLIVVVVVECRYVDVE